MELAVAAATGIVRPRWLPICCMGCGGGWGVRFEAAAAAAPTAAPPAIAAAPAPAAAPPARSEFPISSLFPGVGPYGDWASPKGVSMRCTKGVFRRSTRARRRRRKRRPTGNTSVVGHAEMELSSEVGRERDEMNILTMPAMAPGANPPPPPPLPVPESPELPGLSLLLDPPVPSGPTPTVA